jgi:SAM-dependent methyltransferase
MPLQQRDSQLICGDRSYPIVGGIPRFVARDNYAEDFGLQWNRFSRTQLDSYTGTDISESRLARCFRGHLFDIEGKLVLEAGSGAGRFTEILLKHGAVVHSFDFSSAVEANRNNNGASDRLMLVQADIRAIPFQKNAYAYVICLGVLQHTPSPEESILSLWQMVKPGGYLVIDHYLFKWRNMLPPPIGGAEPLYRKLLLALPRKQRLGVARKIVDLWFPVHWKFRDSLTAQRLLRRISPVHFYHPQLPLKSKELYYEWALLDTHDGTTDYYKHHRSVKQIRQFLATLNAEEVHVTRGGNGVEAFCRKPTGSPVLAQNN